MALTSDASVRAKVAAYLLLNQEIADRKEMQANLKAELDPYLQEAETNTRGSHVIPFSEVLEVNGKRYASLQKTRKESKVLNEDRVIDFLNQKAIDASPDGRPFADSKWYSPIVTVQHVDQDVLWDLFVQDYVDETTLESFFDKIVTWAFTPVKE